MGELKVISEPTGQASRGDKRAEGKSASHQGSAGAADDRGRAVRGGESVGTPSIGHPADHPAGYPAAE